MSWTRFAKLKVTVMIGVIMLALFILIDSHEQEQASRQSHVNKAADRKGPIKDPSPGYAGPEWFDAYHRLIRTKSGERGPNYPVGYRFKEFRKSMSSQNRSISSEKLDWIERGPSNVGGRTRSIWIDPSDSAHLTWFVGSVSGGVWKTENGGNNWSHLTEDLTNLATSVIAGSRSNADILYIGTGEGYSNSITGITGNGIWKSIDKGNNWFPLESTVNNPKFAHIMRIAVNQDNENELVVASRLGRIRDLAEGTPRSFLHRSTDGGLTWAETWHDTLFVQQVISHPANFDTLFAAVNSGGVLRSSDKGVTWRYVADWQADTLLQRLELAISPTNPNLVYAVSSQWRWRIFLSSDSGNNWREVKPINPLHTFSQLGGQGFWNNAVAVHPFEDYVLFVGGQVSILKITIDHTSGGVNNEPFEATTEVIANVWEGPSPNVHVDHHNLTLIPIDIDLFYMINANDGGIAFSRDAGNSFTQTGDTNNREGNHPSFSGYNVTQFYGVDKMNGADRYVGGTQDNSNWISPLDPDSSSHWLLGPDGDGFETIWHYSDPNKLITTTHYSQIHRSDDGGVSWSNVSPAGPGCCDGAGSPGSRHWGGPGRRAAGAHRPGAGRSPAAA